MRIAVIGSGPSGLMAAWLMGRAGLSVTLYEKNERLGKKILASGGGMCNYTHDAPKEDFIKHYGANGGSLKHAFKALDAYGLMDLLKEIGVSPYIREDGKVFVGTRRASDLVAAFEGALARCGVAIRTGCALRGIRGVGGLQGLQGLGSGWELGFGGAGAGAGAGSGAGAGASSQEALGVWENYDVVVMATGGITYPSLGTSGDGHRLLEGLVEMVAPRPALVGFTVAGAGVGAGAGAPTGAVADHTLKVLAGLSVARAQISAWRKQGVVYSSDREPQSQDLLITHTGFSGPLIINSSRYFMPGDDLRINWAGLSGKEFAHFLQEGIEKHGKRKVYNHWLTLQLPESLLKLLFAKSGVDQDQLMATITKAQKQALEAVLLRDTYGAIGFEGLDKAMVTAGGVALSALNLKSFAVKGAPGLYAVGELVDLDGDTGGYNIQAAFSMGYCAAKAIIKEAGK